MAKNKKGKKKATVRVKEAEIKEKIGNIKKISKRKHELFTVAMCAAGILIIIMVALISKTPTTTKGISMTPLLVGETKALTPSILLTLATDKSLYHSKEKMYVTIKITSDDDIYNAQLYIYGISKGGARYKLEQRNLLNITKGDNEQSIDYTLPSCNTCSGLAAGTYHVNADLMLEKKILASANTSIELQQ